MKKIKLKNVNYWETEEVKKFIETGFITEDSFVDLVESVLDKLWPRSGEQLAYELMSASSPFDSPTPTNLTFNYYIHNIRNCLGDLEISYNGYGIPERKKSVEEIRTLIEDYKKDKTRSITYYRHKL